MTQLPPLRLTGADILRDGRLQRRSLAVENGLVARGPLPPVDMSGYLILPGIIDLHGQSFERQIAPRPGARLPVDGALRATAREAAAHGVTTAYLAQRWGWEGGLASPDFAETLLQRVADIAATALIDIRTQLRLDTHTVASQQRLLHAIRRFGIDRVVFHDTLGAFAPKNEDQQMRARALGVTIAAFEAAQTEAKAVARQVPRHLCHLAEAFDTLGVTYGSHGDLDGETRDRYRLLGAHVAECPADPRAAAVAHATDGPVILSAPALMQQDARPWAILQRGLCDILVSDCHYPSLANAAWALVDAGQMDLPRAWHMISGAPAQLMGMHDRGRLDNRARADFVVMNATTREIELTVSAGRLAYLSGEAGARLMASVGEARIAAE